MNEVQSKILSDESVMTIVEENSFIENNHQEHTYYKSVDILDRCATYLLRGQYAENNIMTIFNIRTAQKEELPVSSLNGNANDLVYSDGREHDENYNINAKEIDYEVERPFKSERAHNKLKEQRQNQNTNKIRLLKQNPKYKIDDNSILRWALVNNDNEFIFNGSKYKIKIEYHYEVVLCVLSSSGIFMFDKNINNITDLVGSINDSLPLNENITIYNYKDFI